MQFDIITIFPDIIHSYASESILGRAQKNNLINIKAHNLREFSGNKWGHVDDKPYGGGPGMIFQVEPIYKCLESIGALPSSLSSRPFGRELKAERAMPRDPSARSLRSLGRDDKRGTRLNTKVVLMDPAGKKFNQRMAEKFSKLDSLVIIAGRYEGFDARVYKYVDERVSVGDYVLAGGELPALVITEAVSRLIPGVLGNEESLVEETFGRGIGRVRAQYIVPVKKEYPQYTRPENFMGFKVPKQLLSGNHELIQKWRAKKQLISL